MRKVSYVRASALSLVLMGCGTSPPIFEAKAGIADARMLLDQIEQRLDMVDIDHDGFLSAAEVTIAVSIAWLEWDARMRAVRPVP